MVVTSVIIRAWCPVLNYLIILLLMILLYVYDNNNIDLHYM